MWLVQGGVGDYVMKEAWASIFTWAWIEYGQDAVRKDKSFLSWNIRNGCDGFSLNPRFPAIATSPNDDPRAADVYINIALVHYIKTLFSYGSSHAQYIHKTKKVLYITWS